METERYQDEQLEAETAYHEIARPPEEFPAPEPAADEALQAVLEQKGGEADDWTLEQRGESGYRFDGEHVRAPDGSIWVNEDAALHREMLAQWKEGTNAVFFLPDYREKTPDGETLYVTQLMLRKDGTVSYEIHKHEIAHRREEDASLPAAAKRAEAPWDFHEKRRAAGSEMQPGIEMPDAEARVAGSAETIAHAESGADAWLIELLKDDLSAGRETAPRESSDIRRETMLPEEEPAREAMSASPLHGPRPASETRGTVPPFFPSAASADSASDPVQPHAIAHARRSRDGIIIELSRARG
jgi:hypothetical protein